MFRRKILVMPQQRLRRIIIANRHFAKSSGLGLTGLQNVVGVGPKLVKYGGMRAYAYFSIFVLGGLGYGYLNEMPFSGYVWVAPFMRIFSAETSQDVVLTICNWPWFARRLLGFIDRTPKQPEMKQTIWETNFECPIGIASNYDPSAWGVDGLMGSGLAFVEIGPVTPLESQHETLLKRVGKKTMMWNTPRSEKVDSVEKVLEKRLDYVDFSTGKIGTHLGGTISGHNPIVGFRMGVQKLLPYSDYFVVRLADLGKEPESTLKELSKIVEEESNNEFKKRASKLFDCETCLPPPIPLLLKIDCDYSQTDLDFIVKLSKDKSIRGIVLDGSTKEQPEEFNNKYSDSDAYFLGQTTKEKSTEKLRELFKATEGEVPIIASGGVMNGDDAFEKIRAGASLVQLFSVFEYRSPRMVREIKRQLRELMIAEEFKNVAEAVGMDHEEIHQKRLETMGSTWKPKPDPRSLRRKIDDPYWYKRNRQSKIRQWWEGKSDVRGYWKRFNNKDVAE